MSDIYHGCQYQGGSVTHLTDGGQGVILYTGLPGQGVILYTGLPGQGDISYTGLPGQGVIYIFPSVRSFIRSFVRLFVCSLDRSCTIFTLIINNQKFKNFDYFNL